VRDDSVCLVKLVGLSDAVGSVIDAASASWMVGIPFVIVFLLSG
jgi:hypothetical protein